MTGRAAHELATLATDPDRIGDLDRERVPDLIGELERLRARLWGRMSEPPTERASKDRSDIERASDTRLLKVGEAAPRLGLTEKQLYRRASKLPFTRKLGRRTLRFDERGLEEWVAER